MKSYNKVTLLGHVVMQPEIKLVPGESDGPRTCSLAVATDNEWLDVQTGEPKKSVDFHRCIAWNELADKCTSTLTKGALVLIEGRLTNRAYEGKNQVMHYITEIVLEQVILMPKPKEDALLSTSKPFTL